MIPMTLFLQTHVVPVEVVNNVKMITQLEIKTEALAPHGIMITQKIVIHIILTPL
jgi:hypothetical protein